MVRVRDVVPLIIINPVSFVSARISGNQLFPPHHPLVYVKIFIVLSQLCCTMSMISMEKHTFKQFMPHVWACYRPTRVSLNLQALVYPESLCRWTASEIRQLRRCAWFVWPCGRVELMVMRGGVKSNYEHSHELTSVSKNCRRCYFNRLD